MNNKKIKTILLALVAMALWGSAFPVLKLTYKHFSIASSDTYSKILLAGIRFFISGVLVFIYILFTNKSDLSHFKNNISTILLLGLLSTTINYIFFYIGVGNTSGIKSSIFQSASTFLSVILAFILLKEPISKYKVLAIILGFMGIIVSNLNKSLDFNISFNGEGYLLISGIAMAFSTIFVKVKGNNIPATILTCGQMISGSIILIILGLVGKKANLTITKEAILLLVYSGFLSALAFTIWYKILNENQASEVSILRLFIPIFGAIFSAIILGESFSIYVVLGLILVVLGVYFINKKPSHGALEG